MATITVHFDESSNRIVINAPGHRFSFTTAFRQMKTIAQTKMSIQNGIEVFEQYFPCGTIYLTAKRLANNDVKRFYCIPAKPSHTVVPATAPTTFAPAPAPATFGKATAPTTFAPAPAPATFGKATAPTTFGKATVPTTFGKATAPTTFGKATVPTTFAPAPAPATFTPAPAPATFAPATFGKATAPTFVSTPVPQFSATQTPAIAPVFTGRAPAAAAAAMQEFEADKTDSENEDDDEYFESLINSGIDPEIADAIIMSQYEQDIDEETADRLEHERICRENGWEIEQPLSQHFPVASASFPNFNSRAAPFTPRF